MQKQQLFYYIRQYVLATFSDPANVKMFTVINLWFKLSRGHIHAMLHNYINFNILLDTSDFPDTVCI